MATAKKETAAKATTTKKATTRKKTVKPVEETPVVEAPKEERSLFELMAEHCAAKITDVETPVGTIHIRDKISFTEMITLVNLIVDMCIDDKTGEVKWEFYDFATASCICAVYCGIPASADPDTNYAATCGENALLVEVLLHADTEQIHEIMQSTREKLKSRDALNHSAAAYKLNEFIDRVNELIEIIKSTTDNFSPEDTMDAIRKLTVLTGGK